MRASTRPSGWSRSACGRTPQDHSAFRRIARLTAQGQPTSGTVGETARELVQQTAERQTHHRFDVCRISLIVWKVHVPIALVHRKPVHPAPQSGLRALGRRLGARNSHETSERPQHDSSIRIIQRGDRKSKRRGPSRRNSNVRRRSHGGRWMRDDWEQ